MKMRQAQEVVRISAKHDDDPLKKEFQEWVASSNIYGRKPTVFQMLMCRFKKMKGNTDFDSIEREFKYTKEFMGLIKAGSKVNTEEFKAEKQIQEENVEELLAA